jgi:BirA family biotin operon repressor/biotin-[acetyl-CoA-carboxylase] ligase
MARDERLAGHRVVFLDQTDSTNAHARRMVAAGEAAAGDVVVAERQSAGRGRRGRSWITVPGRSLAASLVLAPPPLDRPARLTVLAAVAACRALERCGASGLAIKWPNDLMRGELKCGGLLLERVAGPDGRALCVLGIGVNLQLRAGDLPPGLAGRAGAAELPADRASRERLLATLLGEMDAALSELGSPADLARGAEYRARSWLTGRHVELSAGGERLSGRVGLVTDCGDLVLDGDRLLPGESVELLAVLPRPEHAPAR